MKVEILNAIGGHVDPGTLKVGSVFEMGYGEEKEIILKTYTGYVSLRRPDRTWSQLIKSVLPFPKGTEIKLTVE